MDPLSLPLPPAAPPAQVILDKSSTDDQLMEALRAEVQRLKNRQQAAQSAAQQAAVAHTTTTATMQGGKLSTSTSTAARFLTIPTRPPMTISCCACACACRSGSVSASASAEAAAAEELLARQSAEILRLQRLCKNQAAQIDSQDAALRALKREKELRRDF